MQNLHGLMFCVLPKHTNTYKDCFFLLVLQVKAKIQREKHLHSITVIR